MVFFLSIEKCKFIKLETLQTHFSFGKLLWKHRLGSDGTLFHKKDYVRKLPGFLTGQLVGNWEPHDFLGPQLWGTFAMVTVLELRTWELPGSQLQSREPGSLGIPSSSRGSQGLGSLVHDRAWKLRDLILRWCSGAPCFMVRDSPVSGGLPGLPWTNSAPPATKQKPFRTSFWQDSYKFQVFFLNWNKHFQHAWISLGTEILSFNRLQSQKLLMWLQVWSILIFFRYLQNMIIYQRPPSHPWLLNVGGF